VVVGGADAPNGSLVPWEVFRCAVAAAELLLYQSGALHVCIVGQPFLRFRSHPNLIVNSQIPAAQCQAGRRLQLSHHCLLVMPYCLHECRGARRTALDSVGMVHLNAKGSQQHVHSRDRLQHCGNHKGRCKAKQVRQQHMTSTQTSDAGA
jgi:hypothetical protein